MIIALSTGNPRYSLLYSHAKELADYMRKYVEFELLSTYYSEALNPEAFTNNKGVMNLQKVEFYSIKNKDDVIILSGDSSPNLQNFEFSEAIIDYSKKIGVKEIYTIGTRWSEPPDPKDDYNVIGCATDEQGANQLQEIGIEIMKEEQVPYFGGIVMGIAKLKEIKGNRLSVNHGETRPHPKSVISLVKMVSKIIGIKIDTLELEEYAKKRKQEPIIPDESEFVEKEETSDMYR